MQALPRKPVDDKLVYLNAHQVHLIAPRSRIAKAWATHIQYHVSGPISFYGLEGLGEWSSEIEPDPTEVGWNPASNSEGGEHDLEEEGTREDDAFESTTEVLRHTDGLILDHVETLMGIEAHIQSFTRITWMAIYECNFLSSPSVVKCLAPIGSGLTQLTINESTTTLRAITSVLAALHLLENLDVEDLKITDEIDETSPIPTIPFFQGSTSSLRLQYSDNYFGQQHNLDWIPDSARFKDLNIDTTHALDIVALVNQWLSNSRATLKSLTMLGDPDAFPMDQLTPLNLSACEGLADLELSVGLYRPGSVVETVLSSITSSRLSIVSLQWEDDFEDEEDPGVGYSAWEVVGNHLLQLAKSFSVGNPGEKMKVKISCLDKSRESDLLEYMRSEGFLSKLKEEVDFSLGAGEQRY